MADSDAMWEDTTNQRATPGGSRYRIDESCIHCAICSTIAPDCFGTSPLGDRCSVHHQPEDAQATARCREALDNCPVEAIGTCPPPR